MNKISIRFGAKLSWPFQNAAVVVFSVTQAQFDQLVQAVGVIQLILATSGQTAFSDKIVLEKR